MRRLLLTCSLLVVTVVLAGGLPLSVNAATITIDAELTGRFLSDGTAENDPSFQNYFVGHTALSGSPFPYVEQRNFFIFDIPVITEVIVSATLTLTLVPSGFISDELPGVPEIYELTSIPFLATDVADITNTSTENMMIFDTLGFATPYASVALLPGDIPPGVPGDPTTDLVLELSSFAVADLMGAGSGLFAMGGVMLTHSFDSPGELDEIMFGFTDVTPTGFSLVPKPVLTIETIPVPEPGTAVLLGFGLTWLARRRDRR